MDILRPNGNALAHVLRLILHSSRNEKNGIIEVNRGGDLLYGGARSDSVIDSKAMNNYS